MMHGCVLRLNSESSDHETTSPPNDSAASYAEIPHSSPLNNVAWAPAGEESFAVTAWKAVPLPFSTG